MSARPPQGAGLLAVAETNGWEVYEEADAPLDNRRHTSYYNLVLVYQFVAADFEIRMGWQRGGTNRFSLEREGRQVASLQVHTVDGRITTVKGFDTLTDVEYYLLNPDRLLTLNRVRRLTIE